MKLSKYIPPLLMLVLATACNNDLFIEERFLEEKEFKLDGDGSSKKVHFQSKGLKDIRIQTIPEQTATVTYIDIDGNESSDPGGWSEDTSVILYSSIDYYFSIGIDGKEMWLNNMGNTSEESVVYYITLDYGKNQEIIKVEASPGAPMRVVECNYDFSKAKEIIPSPYDAVTYSLTNPSDVPLTVKIMPYKGALDYQKFTADNDWAENRFFEMPIPTYHNGFWGLSHNHFVELDGRDWMTTPKNVFESLTIERALPAHSKIEAICRQQTFVIPYSLTVESPGSYIKNTITGTCTISQASSYEIIISEHKN